MMTISHFDAEITAENFQPKKTLRKALIQSIDEISNFGREQCYERAMN